MRQGKRRKNAGPVLKRSEVDQGGAAHGRLMTRAVTEICSPALLFA